MPRRSIHQQSTWVIWQPYWRPRREHRASAALAAGVRRAKRGHRTIAANPIHVSAGGVQIGGDPRFDLFGIHAGQKVSLNFNAQRRIGIGEGDNSAVGADIDLQLRTALPVVSATMRP